MWKGRLEFRAGLFYLRITDLPPTGGYLAAEPSARELMWYSFHTHLECEQMNNNVHSGRA